jgi:hypothetical protein
MFVIVEFEKMGSTTWGTNFIRNRNLIFMAEWWA